MRTNSRPRRRRRGRILPQFAVSPVAVLLALSVAGLLGFLALRQGLLPWKRLPPDLPDWVEQDLLPENPYSRPGLPLQQVRGVVVHYVGNPGTTAEQNRSYFASLAETHETKASAHFVIGLEGEVIQCIPLDEIAYCSNDRNSDTISIECCHPDADGHFTPATQASLLRLTRLLVRAYGLKSGSVLRHYDVTGKLCPLYYVEHPQAWEDFLGEVFS